MFFRHLICLLLLTVSLPSFGCDVCAPMSGRLMNAQNTFGVKFRYRSFNGYQSEGHQHFLFPGATGLINPSVTGASNEPQTGADDGHNHSHASKSEFDTEVFRSYIVWGQYNLNDKWMLGGFVPYKANSELLGGISGSYVGLGDAGVNLAYTLINETDSALTSRLQLKGEARFPTGLKSATNDIGQVGEYIMQPGTGSMTYGAALNYMWRNNDWSGWIVSRGIFTTNNSNNQRLTPIIVNQAVIGHEWQIRKSTLMATAIVNYQYMYGEVIGGNKSETHQMNTLFSGVGVYAMRDGLGIKADLQLPVWQNGDLDHPGDAGIIELGTFYQF